MENPDTAAISSSNFLVNLHTRAEIAHHAAVDLENVEVVLRAACRDSVDAHRDGSMLVLRHIDEMWVLFHRSMCELHSRLNKFAEAQFDLLTDVALQLGVAARACSVAQSDNVHVIAEMAAGLSAVDSLIDVIGNSAPLALPTLSSSPPLLFGTVCSECVDATTTTLCGLGAVCISPTEVESAENVFELIPRTSSGAFASYVREKDIRLTLTRVTDGSTAIEVPFIRVSICAQRDGAFRIAYTACPLECSNSARFQLRLHVRPVPLLIETTILPQYSPRTTSNALIAALDVSCFASPGMIQSLAVSADCKYVAVCGLIGIDIHRLEINNAGLCCALYCEISRSVSSSAFDSMCKLCFTPHNTLLACGVLDNCLVEYTVTGGIIRTIAMPNLCAVAIRDNTLALGTHDGQTHFFDYAEGKLQQSWNSGMKAPNRSGLYTTSMCFADTPFGIELILAELLQCRLSAYSMDGNFTRYVGSKYAFPGGNNGVCVTADGTVLVAAEAAHCIYVFTDFNPSWDAPDETTWGFEGDVPADGGCFRGPVALAAVGGPYLFVLDSNDTVHVFH